MDEKSFAECGISQYQNSTKLFPGNKEWGTTENKVEEKNENRKEKERNGSKKRWEEFSETCINVYLILCYLSRLKPRDHRDRLSNPIKSDNFMNSILTITFTMSTT
jgi:hypothetical protein